MSHADRLYWFVTIFLAIAVIAGGIMLAMQHARNQPVEIALTQPELPEFAGQVYISGAVANPGIYMWHQDDTLEALLLSADVEADADFNRIKIYVLQEGEEQIPQKIDINRAEAWLLEALPGIGRVLAQRIVDYRREHGPFRTIQDLLKVPGIGQQTLGKIKDYITVSD